MAFSTYLRSIRIEKGVNQTQMAEILDISRTAIKLIDTNNEVDFEIYSFLQVTPSIHIAPIVF